MRTWGFLHHSAMARLARALGLGLGLTLSATVAPAGDGAFLDLNDQVEAPAGFAGVCTRYPWACDTSGRGAGLPPDALGLAQTVNLSVNRRTRDMPDARQYGVEEYWALPTAAGGDCEDFALAKKQELIRRGIAPSRLLIATVLDRKNAAHAVLVFRSDTGDLVLDNLTNRIVGWRETGYTFLRIQSPDRPGRWTAVLAGGLLASLEG